MSDFEFVDPTTGAALGAHAFGTVAAGTSSTPKALRLRYKHGQTGSGAPSNALVMRVSENGGSTWRDAVTEFTLAITAVSAPDPLFTERARSLGRGTRWALAPFRAGCYVDMTLTFTPDKRTGAASTPLSWELGIDESVSIPAAFVPGAPSGVLSGIGDASHSEWITAPTLANGTAEVTLGACAYVHAGIRYEIAGGDVALSQDDGSSATLSAAEEYVAVLSTGSAGTVTVTKGDLATAGTAVAPSLPAGELPLATVRVPYGGVIVTSTLHAVSGRCAVSDAGGLVVNIQPGRVSLPGWLATPTTVQQITVADGATAATGSITCVAVANLIDGETVTVAGKVYEFDVAGDGVGGGNVAVDVSTLTTAGDVAGALTLAIYTEGDCAITWDGTSASFDLTLLATGSAGNVTITDTVADAGFLVSGFTGGADGTVTVRLGATGAPSLTDGAALAVVATAAGDILSVTDARRLLGLTEVRLRQAGDATVGTAVAAVYIPYPWAGDSAIVYHREASAGSTGSTDVNVEINGATFASGSVAAQGTSAALTFASFSGAAGWLTLDIAAVPASGTLPVDTEVVLWIARRG